MQVDRASDIINRHVGAAMAAAAVPLPWVDIAAVTAIQIALVRRLARRYGVEYDALRGRAAVLAVAGASLARAGASAVKALPVGGWLLGSASQAALAGASTYALGEAYRVHFETHGAEGDVDIDTLRERYRDAARRGREIGRTLRRQTKEARAFDERTATLARLAGLRRAGVLTEDEWQRLVAPLAADVTPG